MTAPTYDLAPDASGPGDYLRDVSRLADEVIAAGEELRCVVEDYARFVELTGRESVRSHAEYLLEALTLGVLWRARGADACRQQGRVDASLVEGHAPDEPGGPRPALVDLDRLLTWLVASGEYTQEVARLLGWRAFLEAAGPAVLAELVAFATAFEEQALLRLGAYTRGLPGFLRDVLPRRRRREDAIQCARRRDEYHLNMVGAELLNRAWRGAFLRCRRHVVVMPGCMRRQGDGGCKADRTGGWMRCTACAPGCGVRAATEVARRTGAEALAVVHASDLSRALHAPELHAGGVGIVGIACVPGLMGAGWQARAAGLPAQCVLLDAAGCPHWRDDPVPTTVDLRELHRILRPGRQALALALVPAEAS